MSYYVQHRFNKLFWRRPIVGRSTWVHTRDQAAPFKVYEAAVQVTQHVEGTRVVGESLSEHPELPLWSETKTDCQRTLTNLLERKQL